ncbi:hypothetical protein IID62_06005, partial [candidate division KSB1 bacterium]|nr:hypothetical protein [candidate division KSB1 bacterium]
MRLTIFSAFLFLLYSQSVSGQFVQTSKSESGETRLDFFQRSFVVSAHGASNPSNRSLAEKKLWALTEARKNCITQAVIAISEIEVENSTLMEAGRLKSTDISVKIQNYVRGIRSIEENTEILKDGSVIATVSMVFDFDGNEGLNSLLFNAVFPAEEPTGIPLEGTGTEIFENTVFTGYIFNVRDFDIQPSMTPRIYNESGVPVYGPGKVSGKYAARYGIVGYTKNSNNVKDRIGLNPMFIEVIGLKPGDKTSIVISNEDAVKMENSVLLSECRVAFLV